ncbi:MAG: DinB family protein [Saprospiraceae bacterium]|nr:DinB family protein [Saprospiraceae bacterium]
MEKLNFSYIFKNSFETFKVFETIPMKVAGILIEGHTSSIWQILNHLVIWQRFGIEKLSNINTEIQFDEAQSWIKEQAPKDVMEWNNKIQEFDQQVAQLKQFIQTLNMEDAMLNEKLEIVQEASIHLSFHLGEIILMARQKNKYPKPSEMKAFLQVD